MLPTPTKIENVSHRKHSAWGIAWAKVGQTFRKSAIDRKLCSVYVYRTGAIWGRNSIFVAYITGKDLK